MSPTPLCPLSPPGGSCRVDSPDSYMYCPGSSSGGLPAGPESEFEIYSAGSLGAITGQPPAPSTVLLRSVKTGKFCRVVLRADAPVGQEKQVKCDLDSPQGASEVVYNGTSITYQGEPFSSGGCSTCPVYLGQPGSNGSIVPGWCHCASPPRLCPQRPCMPLPLRAAIASQRHVPASTAVPPAPSPPTCPDVPIISTGTTIAPGSLTSPSRRYALSFTKNSLVLVDTATGSSIWEAGPFSSCVLPLTLTMLSNGDLAVVNKRGQVVWHSQSACSCDIGCYRAELQVSPSCRSAAASMCPNTRRCQAEPARRPSPLNPPLPRTVFRTTASCA
jgi:hypothetical protein